MVQKTSIPDDEASEHVNRTYTISRSVVEQIDAMCSELHIWQSDLVDFLLTTALQEIAAGQKTVKTAPVKWKLVRN